MVLVLPGKNPFDCLKFETFCRENHFIFPKSYVDYLKIHNDGDLEPNFLKFRENAVNIRYFYGMGTENNVDLTEIYPIYRDRIPENCIPIAEDDCGNQICMSLNGDSYGKIYFWDHETMDMDENEKKNLSIDRMILIADSFDALCKKICPADAENIPQYSRFSMKRNRLFLWICTRRKNK